MNTTPSAIIESLIESIEKLTTAEQETREALAVLNACKQASKSVPSFPAQLLKDARRVHSFAVCEENYNETEMAIAMQNARAYLVGEAA